MEQVFVLPLELLDLVENKQHDQLFPPPLDSLHIVTYTNRELLFVLQFDLLDADASQEVQPSFPLSFDFFPLSYTTLPQVTRMSSILLFRFPRPMLGVLSYLPSDFQHFCSWVIISRDRCSTPESAFLDSSVRLAQGLRMHASPTHKMNWRSYQLHQTPRDNFRLSRPVNTR